MQTEFITFIKTDNAHATIIFERHIPPVSCMLDLFFKINIEKNRIIYLINIYRMENKNQSIQLYFLQ
jgi:hypothetical protein